MLPSFNALTLQRFNSHCALRTPNRTAPVPESPLVF